MAQVILDRATSSQASPTIYYTVEVEPSARTANGVTLKFTVTSDLQFDSSNKGTGYTMTGGIYVGGEWKSIVLKETNATWAGSSDPYTATGTFTISGLSAAQTSITGVQFRVVSSNTSYNGGTLTATDCADISIDRYGGVGHINVDGTWKEALAWVNVNGAWNRAVPFVNKDGTWHHSV